MIHAAKSLRWSVEQIIEMSYKAIIISDHFDHNEASVGRDVISEKVYLIMQLKFNFLSGNQKKNKINISLIGTEPVAWGS